MKVTVVLLTHHRLELIKQCLMSIERQNENSLVIEIIALINGIDTETENYLISFAERNQAFTLMNLESSAPVGEARNMIIEKSSGTYLCFIDDDVEIPENYFSTAEFYCRSNLDVFGGPDTHKKTSSNFQLVLSKVMESFLAMGPTSLRHSLEHEEQVGTEVNLILCNLWIKKSLFDEGFKFPDGYIRNEENILIGKLKEAGKKMIYTPKLKVFHERKESFKKLIRVTYLSGKFRTYGFFDARGTIRFYFFVPQIFLIALIGLFLYNPELSLFSFLFYISIILFFSIKDTVEIGRLHLFPLAMVFYFIYNFIYPLGQFSGYWKRLRG